MSEMLDSSKVIKTEHLLCTLDEYPAGKEETQNLVTKLSKESLFRELKDMHNNISNLTMKAGIIQV